MSPALPRGRVRPGHCGAGSAYSPGAGQVGVDGGDYDGPFADGRRDPLHGPGAGVTDGEESGRRRGEPVAGSGYTSTGQDTCETVAPSGPRIEGPETPDFRPNLARRGRSTNRKLASARTANMAIH